MKFLGAIAVSSVCAFCYVPVASADSCDAIVKAVQATEHTERRRVRTQMVQGGKPVAIPEAIIVPEGMFQKTGDQWVRNPFSPNSAGLRALAGTPTYADCRLVRSERLNGVAADVYSARVSTTGGVTGKSVSDTLIWVSKSDGLAQQIESRIADRNTTVTQVYSYGPEVRAPAGATHGADASAPGLEVPAAIGGVIKGLLGK